MRPLHRSLLFVLIVAVIAVVVFLIRPVPTGQTELSKKFLKVLPAELTDAQKKEVEGLFARFYARSNKGYVAPEDMAAVDDALRRHIESGSIKKDELYELMARVSDSMYRTDPDIMPPDGSGQHPLLQPDTTR